MTIDDANELVAARLRGAGLRVTLPRRAVLGLITESREHLTADQVRQALSQRGVDLPRSSINNVLGNLARSGLVGRAEALPGPVRFEAESSDHDHYWCARCGLIANVPPEPRRASPPLPGIVTNQTTVYIGQCGSCGADESTEASDRIEPAPQPKGSA